MLPMYSLLSSALFAADNGATIAIVLALITLIGTISAQLVTWHKIRIDARTTNAQIIQEQKRSDVEIAQKVMSETVIVLNDRLRSEGEAHEARIQVLSDTHDREIALLKAEHKRDVARLERKIDRVTVEYDACKQMNVEMAAELAILRSQGG